MCVDVARIVWSTPAAFKTVEMNNFGDFSSCSRDKFVHYDWNFSCSSSSSSFPPFGVFDNLVLTC